MELRTGHLTHRYSRTPSSQVGTRVIPRVLSGQDHPSHVRQLHSGIEHQKQRGTRSWDLCFQTLEYFPYKQEQKNQKETKLLNRTVMPFHRI